MEPNLAEFTAEIMSNRDEWDFLLEKLVISLAPAIFNNNASAEDVVAVAHSLIEELYACRELHRQCFPKTKPNTNHAIIEN
jgi:hypothetical protein